AIPEGWALDAAGQPTTDPAAALAGMMVPLGDAKGTALALMVEALAAGLAGANFGYEASSFLDAAGPPPGTGQLLIAIAPDAFAAAGTDRSPVARIEDLSRVIEDQPGARLPGARRDETAARVIAQGIALDDALMAEIEAVGRG
ncbi:MAG: Ldh family oxidoreductase, partial [Paracoccus sp. (in: a-proteobacteria)]|nr:Ldh family oxidoreductase [Paracoccus sp. (in: a-proteobacteria)]